MRRTLLLLSDRPQLFPPQVATHVLANRQKWAVPQVLIRYQARKPGSREGKRRSANSDGLYSFFLNKVGEILTCHLPFGKRFP
jgi:hypothetical protein